MPKEEEKIIKIEPVELSERDKLLYGTDDSLCLEELLQAPEQIEETAQEDKEEILVQGKDNGISSKKKLEVPEHNK